MKSKILDYFDFEKANTLLEGFNRATDFATAILDLDGNILSKSGWRQICTDFHRKNPETALNCVISDTELADKMRDGEKYHFYQCINGLVDVRTPIVIRGEHIANLYSGQFFFEIPDKAFFKNQAKIFGFDENTYLDALEKVPIVSKEKVEVAMKFMLDIIQMVIDMTVEKIEQAELNEVIIKNEKVLSENQLRLEQNMNDLLESQRIAHVGTWRLNLATNQVVWSEELYKIYGFDPTVPPPPYTEHMKLFTPESWVKLSASLEHTSTSGIPYELELETVKSDGSNGWIWVRGEAEKDLNGNIVSLHGAARDITEDKRTQFEIVESKEYFETMFNTNLDAALVTRLSDGSIINVNDGFSTLTGYSRAEAEGRTVLDLNLYYEPTDRHRIVHILKENRYCIGEELLFQRADKSIFTGLISARLIILKGLEYIITNVHDITGSKEAEYALRTSEEKYRSLFDQSILGIYLHDIEGRILDVNKAACLQLKYSRDEFLNLNIFDLHPNKADTVNLPREEILRLWHQWQPGHQGVFEGEHQRKDGTIIPVQISTGPVLYEEDKRIMALVQDITDRKQAKEALIHSHDLMRYIVEHNRGAVAVLDKDLKFLYVSKRYIDDCMIKEDSIIGKYNDEVFPDFPQKWRDAHQKALMGEITGEEKDAYLRNDGSLDWICWECRPWYEFDGSVGGIIAYTEIITERIKLLEDLKEKEYNLRTAQEIAHVGSFDYDPAGDKLMCSDESLSICGITQKEFSGEKDAIMRFIHPEERKYALEMNFKAITEKKVMKSELRIIRQNGEERIVDFRVGPVFDENGNCVRTTGTIQDITERKKAEENLIYISNHDYLTGLYNRTYFEEAIKRLDVKENLPLSVIMIDTNGLKIINDSFGHVIGDELLKKSVNVIKQACRAEDIIVRYGGDEFVVVLPNTNDDEALKIASSIKELASQEKVANIELSVSYGYAAKHSANESMMEILANAENHMYSHKLNERSSMRSKQIEIIMNTLFEKSHRESQHSMRVGMICEAIADKMNFEKQEVNQMRVAGLVHDIGKIGIDEKILNKSGKLDTDERTEIERHPEAGWRILSTSNEFEELAKYILRHHERWDGNGYPDKLTGENIPIESRIITVADAYDAMTSERSYKAAMSHEEAVEEIQRCSGTHFDPAIVDVFVNEVLTADNDFSRGGKL